jgi:signal recognition particle receptor subunit beta
MMTETPLQRLMGASLLVFKNKSDVPDAMSEDDIRKASLDKFPCLDSGPANAVVCRVSSWTRSQHMDGLLELVVLLREMA